MSNAPSLLACLIVGLFLWTFGEYTLHRFAMHALRGRGVASREHLYHHAQRDSVLEKWLLSWVGVLVVGVILAATARVLVGDVGAAVGVGWVVGYGFYDWIHWRAHRRHVANAYERWVRQHHFHHHFGHPMENHGVTTPLWDIAFGTRHRVEGQIKVPRRMAMRWLVDDAGEVLPRYRADYRLVGMPGRSAAQAKEDHDRAFANEPPRM